MVLLICISVLLIYIVLDHAHRNIYPINSVLFDCFTLYSLCVPAVGA